MSGRDRTAARGPIAAAVGPTLALILPLLAGPGCTNPDPPALVVATTWPEGVLAEVEAAYRRGSGDAAPIVWVPLVPGERLEVILKRRGGVDVLLGGPLWEFARLADRGQLARLEAADHAPWRLIRRPRPKVSPGEVAAEPIPAGAYADPRDDPATLAVARSVLGHEGWAKGYETLVRRGSAARPSNGRPAGPSALGPAVDVLEGLGFLGDSSQVGRSRRFVRWLAEAAVVEPPPLDAIPSARADGLLADLLGSALVDAHDELRDAGDALQRHDHPPKAEAAIGEPPPWPPASVARLMASPSAAPLLDSLLEQVAPDAEAREWLRASWSGPRRSVDGPLLAEIAGALDGKLAREPRFRGWLRGEWTAWDRQLYRRVARVAGGYNPS